MVHFSVLNHLGDSLLEILLTANTHMHNWKCTLLEVKKSSPPTAIRGEIIYSVSSCHLSLFQSFFSIRPDRNLNTDDLELLKRLEIMVIPSGSTGCQILVA